MTGGPSNTSGKAITEGKRPLDLDLNKPPSPKEEELLPPSEIRRTRRRCCS
jgi:hypothetical protein